ncbi:uncharacterized protein LOC131152081 isoform X2 [Malania oleifera]|uniref:uncharacterized protein LOC131152081 isoform X2 n=1 Tax=Malania oleifera TaxID=397392 RepID=UPI0025AEAF88|nr:uncharacterized protein LOC131152081 isoform X2 [Malania oleifera]
MEQSQTPGHSPSFEDCLKLLTGERDEQRLAGLLLVPKFCKGDDYISIRRVYEAVGVRFLDRLLTTGLGKGNISTTGGDSRDAYLQLSVTVLAAFCRVPEIASSEDMLSKIPLILEVMLKESGSPVLEDCYEFLFLVSTACENGVAVFCETGGMSVLASRMSTLPDGSHSMELAMKLVQLILSKLSLDSIRSIDLSIMVTTIARQFAVLHNALKFEALHLLSAVLPKKSVACVREALDLMQNGMWATYIRVGIVAILQNRVAPAEKLQALTLAEAMISVLGEEWLIGDLTLPGSQDSYPRDRCILLVLESSRVEIAVLLNELAYLKYEASKDSSSNIKAVPLKQQNLAIVFNLVEKIIKLISNLSADEGDLISERTFTKVISGFNETIGVVLEYLQDAKEHKQIKGNDLLASVRIVGSYLAETPFACEERVRELLGYMLSIEGEDEPSPFYSICFLLPMLCQITMKIEGCEILASSGGFKAVVECLIKLIGLKGHMVEDNGSIFLACDTIMNLLLKREQMRFPSDECNLVGLLKALVYWTDDTDDLTIIMMASSLCALLLGYYTSEDALLNHPEFDCSSLHSLSQLIVRSLATCTQEMSDDAKAEMDLHEIVTKEYSQWAHRFPHIKEAVER